MSKQNDRNIHSFCNQQLVIYLNGTKCQIGKIKRLADDGAFVWYNEGDTAAKTPYEYLYPLDNDLMIDLESLGGRDYINEMDV